MYLKYIELFGFKTFPDKIRIPFDIGINIIVGPNGCGKTNIVDAIRFILGEQALKDLRLKNMNDIIFHGSNLRGQSSVALCRCVFVNDPPLDFKYKDFSEIMVERRHFKNKETDYKINGFSVPYREYIDFFSGSGLSKYYSIVDSSKINAILNYRPNDLRLFFEEASGVTKYKAQKKSASRKLNLAELNLLRISDLCGEVENRLISLKGQFEVLKKYKELEKDKSQQEFVLRSRLKRKINYNITKHSDALDNYSALLIELETKNTSTENNLAGLKTLFDDFDDRYKLAVNKKNNILINLTKLDSDIEHEELTIKKLESELENKYKEAREQNDIKNRNINKLKDLKNKELNNESIINALRKKLDDLNVMSVEKKRLVSKIKDEIEAINNNILDTTEKSQNINNKLIFNDKNIKNVELRIIDTNRSILKISGEIKIAEDELAAKNDFFLENTKNLTKLRGRNASESEKLSKFSNNLESLVQINYKLEKELAGIDIAISKLSDFIDNREGFSEGTKRLLNSSRDYNAYPLSDLIETESGYENIVWAGFGDLLETVVVNNINDAEKALNYINNTQKGQTKIFIPGTRKNKISDKDSQKSIAKEDGFKQRDIIPLQDKIVLNHNNVPNEIFDLDDIGMNFYYYKDCADILDYIRQTGVFPEIDIVTNDGVIFLSSGFIIAGKNKSVESQNLLLSKKKLSEYKNFKVEKEGELSENNLLSESLRADIKNISSDIDKLNKDIRLKEIDELTVKNDIKYISNHIAKSDGRLAILKKDLKNIESEKIEAIEENIILKDERLSLEDRLKSTYKEKEILDDRLKSLEGEFEAVREDELKLRIEISSAEQNFNFLKKEIKGFEVGIINYSKRIDNLNLQINNIKNEIKLILDDISNKRNEVVASRDALKSEEADIDALEANLEGTREDISELEKELEDVKKDRGIADKKKDSALTYLNMYRERLSELERDEFSEDESTAPLESLALPADYYDKLSEDDIKKNIEKFKISMLELGDVNMSAASEYEGALNRQDFLLTQKNDLENSINSLENIIKKLDLVSKEKFNLSLKQIRLKFNELFVFLFGGGHADILKVIKENEDEGDLPGMEINVQMQGKKLSGIHILSQGERVLIAVSLLFAIFLVKKTPFCVIDEVDAPLDYANNARYNRLIKEISKYSQVILVTHNKKTMEIGKNIFGVTSKQPGISKIVSVSMS